jgi:hypothetical protein
MLPAVWGHPALLPPPTSMTRARGAHSYSRRSLAGAVRDTGLQNTPPPCGIGGQGAGRGRRGVLLQANSFCCKQTG